jgi:ring-1,2-phenylacetyl-CoA epoxidase subunit PaaB
VKRGKQHKYVGSVDASGDYDALLKAREQFGGSQVVYNVWIVPSDLVLRSDEESKEIWNTLPEKTFRDAISYKAGEKLKKFKESHS